MDYMDLEGGFEDQIHPDDQPPAKAILGATLGLFALGTGAVRFQINQAGKPYSGSYIEVPRVDIPDGKRLRSDIPDVFKNPLSSRKKRKVLKITRLRKSKGWVFVWK